MTLLALAPTPPCQPAQVPMHRFTVDEYQRMIRSGILTDEDAVELLEGWIVEKMPRNPPHDAVVARLLNKVFAPRLPADWYCRGQSAMRTATSQPEPDVAVVRGTEFDYLGRHPNAADIALIVEVADSTVDRDRNLKGPMYAGAGVPVYWIINLPDRQVEVYTDPTGPTAEPKYRNRADVGPDGSVPLVIAGRPAAVIPAADILPPEPLAPEAPL